MQRRRGDFRYGRDFPKRFLTYYRVLFAIKALLRWLRVQKPVTQLLGFQYQVASDLIEIDLTYLCNLRCNNCNRSSAQAPAPVHLSLNDIRRFVDESLAARRDWARIRLLGGEPTLHPDFAHVIAELRRYKEHFPATRIQLVTNGFGQRVQSVLERIPDFIEIENSSKIGTVQPEFGPFNLAPQDSQAYRFVDYRNGCSIMKACGVGLTPQGYYPCAVAGGIDRVRGMQRGRSALPGPEDQMRDLLADACALCGRFRDGHFVPIKLRKPLVEQRTSRSWQKIYAEWHQRHSSKPR